ncbi:MAG: 4a-hydroxytetrahydrobiopterin dehydratase, partial [Patescibacteria group bacterium]
MKDLASQKCIPCEGATPPLSESAIALYVGQLKTVWDVIEGKKISKVFSFKDFLEAMRFVNRVADSAEKEGHHPDIHIFYNKVKIEISTHAIGGLSVNDF